MARPKRVLVLIDSWFPYIGGGPVHVWELARELVHNYSYKVTVITRKLPGDTCLRTAPYQFKGNLLVHALGPALPWEHPAGRLWYLVRAFLVGMQTRADIIHAHAFSPCWVAKILGKLKKCPVVVTVHGTRLQNNYGMGHGALDGLYRYLEEEIMLRTLYDRVISVDERFLQLRNVNKSIVVIPNGTHIPKERKKKREQKTMQLLFVGRLVAQKNVVCLLEALGNALRKFAGLRLVVVGDGPERSFLTNMTKRLGLSSYVQFVGLLPEEKLGRYYTDADAFVLPSLYEGHSLSLLMACAYGLPIVATDVGANRGMVRDGVNGYLIPAGSSAKLSNAIFKLCKSTDRQKMGSKSRELVARYSWANTARQTHRVYRELLSQ